MSTSPSPSSLAPPSDGDASDGAATDAALVIGAPAAEAGVPLAAADVASLLAASQSGVWGDGDSVGGPDTHAYDGHVALALDPGTLAGIDLTLDLLTASHQLFDVPVLDIGGSDDVVPT
jgi:hypothetical protein